MLSILFPVGSMTGGGDDMCSCRMMRAPGDSSAVGVALEKSSK